MIFGWKSGEGREDTFCRCLDWRNSTVLCFEGVFWRFDSISKINMETQCYLISNGFASKKKKPRMSWNSFWRSRTHQNYALIQFKNHENSLVIFCAIFQTFPYGTEREKTIKIRKSDGQPWQIFNPMSS